MLLAMVVCTVFVGVWVILMSTVCIGLKILVEFCGKLKANLEFETENDRCSALLTTGWLFMVELANCVLGCK